MAYSRARRSARKTRGRARRKQSRLGLRMGRSGFRSLRRKGRAKGKWSTVKKYRRMANNPMQFPVPFVSAMNPGRSRKTRRGRKSTRRASKRTARKSYVRRAKAQTRRARRKARHYVGKHRAKSRRGGNSKRALNRALYHARGGRFSRKNPRRGRRTCGSRY